MLVGDLVRVKPDQVVLTREPNQIILAAIAGGMKKASVEVAVAYDTRCVTISGEGPGRARVAPVATSHGISIARPGIGFASAVHLERFACPARLALTDDPRLAATGGVGMLALVASPSQLVGALTHGSVQLRPPRSIQVLLSGRIRPFVCVRDVALELCRRGLRETIERIDREHGAPVVIEFAGPSARLLSVPDRAVLCALAPQLGAAGAVFVSDEKTDHYLRDQKRSKAWRVLAPDAGAPCDDVLSVDLSAIDPLLMDESGVVRPVRDLQGKPVSQVVLGGDSGASLRDMLAAAALLRSKKVPPHLDFLVAPPSRQVFEVLARAGSGSGTKVSALVDLVSSGARLVEPDQRLLSGELYPPPAEGLSMRTFDPEPRSPTSQRFIVASAETLAYAVAYGKVGDPRSFKRPVRVTVPRTLPTDDVLVVRKGKARSKAPAAEPPSESGLATAAWNEATDLAIVAARTTPAEPSALVANDLDDVRWIARNAAALSPNVRAVISTHIPSGTVPVLAGLGILALVTDDAQVASLSDQPSISIPAPETWDGERTIRAGLGKSHIDLEWLAVDAERKWTAAGTAVGEPPPARRGRR